MNFYTRPRAFLLPLLLVFAIILVAGSFWVGKRIQRVADKKLVSGIRSVRQNSTEYKFINPLLANRENPLNENLSLEASLKKLVTNQSQDKVVATSIYFRDFEHSNWAAIDADHSYDPASMLKVVVMIAYFKQSEVSSGLFAKAYIYNGELNGVLNETPSNLKVGQLYLVKNLIEEMIENSDNGATALLLKNINNQTLQQVYADLGLPDPAKASTEYRISPRDYSLFFRILYNATYLSRENSEQALDILSRATYKDGLVKSLPADLLVAHKFGQHIEVNGSVEDIELHDCGIVYAPNHKYYLCVMTEGSDSAAQAVLISNISKLVYDQAIK